MYAVEEVLGVEVKGVKAPCPVVRLHVCMFGGQTNFLQAPTASSARFAVWTFPSACVLHVSVLSSPWSPFVSFSLAALVISGFSPTWTDPSVIHRIVRNPLAGPSPPHLSILSILSLPVRDPVQFPPSHRVAPLEFVSSTRSATVPCQACQLSSIQHLISV